MDANSQFFCFILACCINYPVAEQTDLTSCPECEFKPKKGKLLMPVCLHCNCDLDCLKYGDCCIDILLKFSREKLKPSREFTCISEVENKFKFDGLNEMFGYFMTNTYQFGTNRVECSDQTADPVTSLSSGVTYVNMECAIKNKERLMTPWLSTQTCSDGYTCLKVLHAPGNISLRICDKYRGIVPISDCAVSTISANNSALKEACERYYYPVHDNHGKIYQNIYCYKCTGGPLSSIMSEGMHPLRALTSFQEDFVEDVISMKCNENTEWLDVRARKCRKISCFDNAELVNNTCQITEIDVHKKYFEINFKVTIQGHFELATNLWKQILGNTFSKVASGIHSIYYSLEVSQPYRQVHVYQERTEKLTVRYIKCWCQVTEPVLLLELQRDIDQIIRISNIMGELISDNRYINNQPINITFSQYYHSDPIYQLCCNQLSQTNMVNDALYTPFTEQLTCPTIQFDSEEFTESQLSAFVSHLNITLQTKQYHVNTNNKLVVCLSDVLDLLNSTGFDNISLYVKIEEKSEDYIAWYLTIVCISFSLISLAISFLTFLVHSELRTLPGKTSMALMVSLFLAQLTLLTGIRFSHDVVFCRTMGIIIHYLWLTTIFWMHICSFHMFKVFVLQNLTRSPNEGHLKNMLKYGLYAHGVPIIVITATVSINLHLTDGVEIGYGGVVCYLSTKQLILYSFVVPLIFVVICNIAFFILTIISIQRVQIMGRQTGGERNNVYIYLKLSVVTGLFWIIALLAETFNSTILEYLSIFLNGSQGVFLFVAFTVNRNVLRLWKSHMVRIISTTESKSSSQKTIEKQVSSNNTGNV